MLNFCAVVPCACRGEEIADSGKAAEFAGNHLTFHINHVILHRSFDLDHR